MGFHGYKDLFKKQVGYDDSGSCLDYNDVECFDNPDWDDESDAVVRLINGIYYGSGALVNNTANDYTPYLLTAFHNIDVNQSGAISVTEEATVANCLFQFHYKSPTCNGSNSSYIQFLGGDLVASLYDSDFALIELEDSPVGNENITFLGWDNRNNTPTSGTIIHHPSGDVMKISLSNTSPNIVGNFWEYQFYSGITEGGSSGGPVLNQNNMVVGQLLGTYTGDPISCSNQDGLTLYGKFDISWDDNNNNDNQLAHWLDPNDTGDPTTDLIRSPSITVPDVICHSGTTVSMQDPPGVTITWGGTNVSYPYGNTGTSVTVRAASSSVSGEGTVTASFSVNGIQHTITHPVWVGGPDFTPAVTGNSIVTCDYSLFTETNHRTVTWSVYGPLQIVVPNYGYRCVVEGTDSGYGWVYATVSTDCGSERGELFVEVSCRNKLLSFVPNPTTGETVLIIETTPDETEFDETAEWELEVYDNVQNLKLKKNKVRSKSTKIQTANWKEGVYLVRVKYKDEILTGKLVVKK